MEENERREKKRGMINHYYIIDLLYFFGVFLVVCLFVCLLEFNVSLSQ